MTNITCFFLNIHNTEDREEKLFFSDHSFLFICLSVCYNRFFHDIMMIHTNKNEKCWSFSLHNPNIMFYFELSNLMKTWKN